MPSDTDNPVDKLKGKAKEGIDKVTGKDEEGSDAKPEEITTDEKNINAEQKSAEDHDR